MQREIHAIWVGNPMPEPLLLILERWRSMHRHWNVTLWEESDIRHFPLVNQELYNMADSLTDDAHHAGQLRSDIVRYEILHRLGGLYVDCDLVPLRVIDDLVDGESFGMAWETDDMWLGNGLIYAAAPGHGALEEIIERLALNVMRRDPMWRPNKMTGPQYVTPLVRDRDDVTLWPSSLVYPVRWNELDRFQASSPDYGDAFTVHLWANSHRRAHHPLPEVPAP